MLKHRIRLEMLWVAVIGLLLASLSPVFGQSIYATLTGVVSDPTQAVVPNAKVTLTNSASGDVRRSVTNAEGYFTFASIPVGTYDVKVESAGMQSAQVTGLSFTGAEKRNIDIVLKVGSSTDKVEVTSVADVLTPVDSGEKSSTLTTKQLQDFSVVGRSAAEFIKILPGFAGIAPNGENRASFTGETIGINGNGDGGSQSALNNAFSVNGLPTNSLDITADGAHVSDPGCNCATPVNPNTDMIQEFKVQTSNFSAENQKGPAVISSVSKAGGRDFHGGAYLYARHSSLNANDWLNNQTGTPRPANKYFFPGGNIGGPVLIPGTKFNKDRNKLFFFTGFEEYFQTLDTGLLRATVPTAGMRNGDFSPNELAKLGKRTSGGGAPQTLDVNRFPGGIIPANQIDKNAQALTNLLPAPNANSDATGGFNYVRQIVFDQNSTQWLSRVDYNISDNTKLYLRYNLQRETQLFPVGLWWRNGNQVPYPTPVEGRNRSHSITASLTHVFNPTMTNEFVFGWTFIAFPNVFQDPSKVDRTKVGYNYTGLFKTGVKQIPAFTGWGGELATLFNPGGFEVGGSRGLFADKYLPTFSDSLSKVWGTHTAKFGFFYEYIINKQPANNYTNGLLIPANWSNNSTGAVYGDLLTGRLAQYEEESFNRLNDIAYNQYEFYAQDSWKVNRRLTLEYGLRASHFQPWVDRLGFGYTVFTPQTYDPKAAPTDYSGFSYAKRDPKVPTSGFPSRALFWQPRVGAAYDVFGTGKTVLRGGWGRFYYHSAQFTAGLDVSAGVRKRVLDSSQFTGGLTLNQIDALGASAGDRLAVSAVDSKSDKQPYSDSYSVTVSQRMPFASLVEVAYVGNRSRDLPYTRNANLPAVGYSLQAGVDPNTVNQDNFRPFQGFQDVSINTHGAYTNYNSLQVQWLRTKGRYNLQFNYTYGKALGIVRTGGDALFDPYNLKNNYGVLAGDRRQIFNAVYSIELGSPVKVANKFVKGALNGWQFSGITQISSGNNLTGVRGNFNYNLDTGGARALNGKLDPNGYQITPAFINGTSQIALRPRITCDPSSGLKDKQFINASCFSLPTATGQNGPIVPGAVYGPAFFNSDLGLFKNFQISESKKLQFRFNAYNFLNHPLDSFIDQSPNTKLTFDGNPGSPTYGQVSNPVFGRTTEKQGRRIVQLALKFYF